MSSTALTTTANTKTQTDHEARGVQAAHDRRVKQSVRIWSGGVAQRQRTDQGRVFLHAFAEHCARVMVPARIYSMKVHGSDLLHYVDYLDPSMQRQARRGRLERDVDEDFFWLRENKGKKKNKPGCQGRDCV